MIEIILSVCWLGDAGRCREVTLTYFGEAVTAHQCLLYGQAEMAKWSEANPKWTIKRWSCGKPSEIARI